MPRYVAFDVETPNRYNDRISAIGISVIEDGNITEEFYSLVNPETFFDNFNIQLTGITPEAVKDAPTFAQLWPQIEPIMSSGLLIAHNAIFDTGVLKQCFRAYGIEWRPYFHYACTVQMGRKLLPGMRHGLNDLCNYYHIELDHHNAASDSHGCAEILLRYLEAGVDIRQFIRTCSMRK